MARRDNQGIQIAMIVFILTTLLFMVGTYLGYSSWATAKGELDQMTTNRNESQTQMQSASRAADAMKVAIGLDQALGDDAAQSQATDSVNGLGAGLPEESRNYLGIIRARDARIADLAGQLKSAKADLRESNDNLDAARANNEKMIAAARADAEKANAEFIKQRDDFDKARQTNETELARITNAERSKVAAAQKAAADANKLAAAAKLDKEDAQGRAKNLQGKLNEIDRDTPDQYDGQVLGVIAATKTVLVDLGRADGVRPKTTFGIYDADDTNVRTAKKKASIEITRVISDHRSEARITEINYSSPSGPPVADDYIYSPVWSPGRRLGIALVGELDIDQDGHDDRSYLKTLINRNGGQVDADAFRDKSTGNISVNTRYIVQGAAGLVNVGGETVNSDSKAERALLLDAEKLSVEKMSLDELMDLMSTPGAARSISYGSGKSIPSPGDFAPRPVDGINRVSSGLPTSFRKREPTTNRRFRVK